MVFSIKKTYIKVFFAILLIACGGSLCADKIQRMEFRNQSIADILTILADVSGMSVILDETITGNASFLFGPTSFEDALEQFSRSYHLHYNNDNGVYYISKVRVTVNNQEDSFNVFCNDTKIEHLIKKVSRAMIRPIVYDPLPNETITISAENISVSTFLTMVLAKYPEYSIINEKDFFYIKRQPITTASAQSRVTGTGIRQANGVFNLNIQRAPFNTIITDLFRLAGKEYALMHRSDPVLENLYFNEKSFEEILRLILQQANSDYILHNNVYYIIEVQRRDILRSLKNVTVIEPVTISVQDLMLLFPPEYNAASLIRADKNTNSMFITGTPEETGAIIEFVAMVETRNSLYSVQRYDLSHIKVSEFIGLLPQFIRNIQPVPVPGTNSFLVSTDEDTKRNLEKFISDVDLQSQIRAVRLQYIQSTELIKNIPPALDKDMIIPSLDPTLVYLRGSAERYNNFLTDLALIDQPKPQIRYHLLVTQFLKSDSLNWAKTLTANPSVLEPNSFFSASLTNIFNLNFDVISKFGYQFALKLNYELGANKARVLADTVLNSLSGQDVKFQNTNTFRYRDTAIDPQTGKPVYNGVTREISSGLMLNVNGWVSGDGMITMTVNAQISKQGSDTGASTNNPPPTSEKIVNTQVRTASGTPIVIGGLLQLERNEMLKKTPLLGQIPVIGRLFQDITIAEELTEMVIYIVPYIHQSERVNDGLGNIDRLYAKYFLESAE